MLVRSLLAFVLALGILGAPARAEELTAAKRADIERLLVATGAVANGKQMAALFIANMTQMLKAARPDIPQHVLDALPGEVTAVIEENIGALKEITIPIYHKHFTAAEIKGMLDFYSTDLGKKTIRVMPLLMQEGAAAGQRWGESLGPQLDKRIRAKLKRDGINI